MREKASKILGIRIGEGEWSKVLAELWTFGRPNAKEMKELLFMLLEEVDNQKNER